MQMQNQYEKDIPVVLMYSSFLNECIIIVSKFKKKDKGKKCL